MSRNLSIKTGGRKMSGSLCEVLQNNKGKGMNMKKIASILLFLTLAFIAQAELVDDFESYAPGVITQVTGGKWVPAFGGAGTDPGADSTVRQIAVDPTDPLNQVIYLETNNTGQYSMYGIFPPACVMADGATNTFFTKVYVTTTALDESFGLTSVDAPTNFANFLCQVAFVRGNLLVRNGGSSTDVGDLVANTWYYIWIVVNNQANTYSVYVKTTEADATVADRVAQDFAFRTIGTSNPDGALDRFLTVANYGSNITAGTRMHFDNMEVMAGEDLRIPASGKPYDPNPANNATNVGDLIGNYGKVSLTLSWKAGPDPDFETSGLPFNPAIKKHYVYISKDQTVFLTDPNVYYTAEVDQISTTDPVAEYVPDPPLNAGAKYFWRIEEGLDNGLGGVYPPGDPNNIMGNLWTFETRSSLPLILTQPVGTRILLGASADPAFTISVSSTTPESYQWFYSADATIGGDTEIGDDDATLSIANAAVSDQGYYYCRVANAATVSGGGYSPDVYSDLVPLVIGRLVAEYKFEQNLTDSSGEGNHGNEEDTNKPTYGNTDPLDGYYAVLNGTSQYADFGTSGYPKAGPLTNGIGGGMDAATILCWVRPTKSGVVLSNYNDGTTTGFAFSIETNYDTRINARGESVEIATVQGKPDRPGWNLLDGQWHMLAVRWDAQAQICAVYVDGQWVVADTSMGTPALYAAWQRGVILGASRNFDNRSILQNFYGGDVDNLRVYNYPLTPAQIAQEYLDATGIQPCVNMTFTGYQYNFDNTGSSYCRIDLADFAAFAQNWLTSGLYVEP
jgi:hypothetical protein